MGTKQKLSLVLVFACFFCVPAYGQQPRLELIEVGGPVATPAIRVTAGGPVGNCDPANNPFSMDVPSLGDGNIARAPDAVAFGSSSFYCNHANNHPVENINDGVYGACSKWKGGFPGAETGPLEMMTASGPPANTAGNIESRYVGIYWTGGPRTIDAIALGRDNDCLQGVAGDRHQYPFTLQYTTDDLDFPHERWLRPDKGVAEATWISVGTMQGHLTGPQPWKVRHLYEFTPITARAVRVLVMNQDIRRLFVSSFTIIDELEVFSEQVPPP